MKLSSADIKLEEVRKYKYVKNFIDALKKSSNYIADVYINHHLAISCVVHFIEIRNSLVACINGLVSFTKSIYANHINVKIHKSGSNDIIMQSSTRVNECIEIGDQDVDLYVPVINTHPYVINNRHVPNSKFNLLGTDRVIPVDLDSQPSNDSSGGGDDTVNWNETGTYISTSDESDVELNYMPAMPNSQEVSVNANRMILRKNGDNLVAEIFTPDDEDNNPSFTAEAPLNGLQDGNIISGTNINEMTLTRPSNKTDRKVRDYINLSGDIDVRDIESNPYIAVKIKSNGEWQLRDATYATATYTNKNGIEIIFTANEPGEKANNYRLISEGWTAYTDGSIDSDYGTDFSYTSGTHFTLTPVSLWGGTIKLVNKYNTDELIGPDSIISYLQNGDGYEDIHAARCMALAVTNQDSLIQRDGEWYSGDAYFDMGSSGNLSTSPFYGNILNYITFDVERLDLYVDDLDYGTYDDDEYHLDVTFSGGSDAYYEWVESNNNG